MIHAPFARTFSECQWRSNSLFVIGFDTCVTHSLTTSEPLRRLEVRVGTRDAVCSNTTPTNFTCSAPVLLGTSLGRLLLRVRVQDMAGNAQAASRTTDRTIVTVVRA